MDPGSEKEKFGSGTNTPDPQHAKIFMENPSCSVFDKVDWTGNLSNPLSIKERHLASNEMWLLPVAAQRVLVGKVRAADVALALAGGGGGAPRPPAHRVHLRHVVFQLRLQRESEQTHKQNLMRGPGQKGRMVYVD